MASDNEIHIIGTDHSGSPNETISEIKKVRKRKKGKLRILIEGNYDVSIEAKIRESKKRIQSLKKLLEMVKRKKLGEKIIIEGITQKMPNAKQDRTRIILRLNTEIDSQEQNLDSHFFFKKIIDYCKDNNIEVFTLEGNKYDKKLNVKIEQTFGKLEHSYGEIGEISEAIDYLKRKSQIETEIITIVAFAPHLDMNRSETIPDRLHKLLFKKAMGENFGSLGLKRLEAIVKNKKGEVKKHLKKAGAISVKRNYRFAKKIGTLAPDLVVTGLSHAVQMKSLLKKIVPKLKVFPILFRKEKLQEQRIRQIEEQITKHNKTLKFKAWKFADKIRGQGKMTPYLHKQKPR